MVPQADASDAKRLARERARKVTAAGRAAAPAGEHHADQLAGGWPAGARSSRAEQRPGVADDGAQTQGDVGPARDVQPGLQVLVRELRSRQVHTVAGFLALPGEVDLREVYAQLQADGVRIVVPRVRGERMEFSAYDPTSLSVGRFGITEPTADDVLALDACQAVLVPALACDESGHRLGRGGGYYDRALAGLPPQVWKVGCVPDALLWPHGQVPVGAHDVRMDAVVTPRRLLLVDSG